MTFDSPLPEGVFTATLTPLKKDLSIDTKLLIDHIKWLLANGSDGIALWGTTGEANSFDLSERMQLLEHVIESGIPGNRLMVGTGCCAYPDTISLTKHAVKLGVGGILLLPPFYYKNIDAIGLLKYFDILIKGVNDNRLKIYLYHFPKMTGISFTLELIKILIDEFPKEMIGIKDSSGDWNRMKSIIEAIPGFKVYAGTENLLLPTLKAGGAGCISATANMTCTLAAKVKEDWRSEKAESLQEHLSLVRNSFEGYPFSAILKQIMSKFTHNTDWLNIRPPNSLIRNTEVEKVEKALIELDFSLNR